MFAKALLQPRLLAAATCVGVALTACGGGTPQASAPSPTPSGSESPTAEPTPEPTGTRPDPAALIGSVIWTGNQTLGVCGGQQAEEFTLRPGARALLRCDASASLVDLLTGETLWTTPALAVTDNVDETMRMADVGLYLIRSTTTPATGLAAASVAHELSKYDDATGQVAWTKPLESTPPPGAEVDDSPDFVIHDGTGPRGLGSLVVVEGSFVSAFDGTSGKPLWAAASLVPEGDRGEYVDAGLAVARNGSSWTAYTVQTGAKAWAQTVPDVGVTSYAVDGDTWFGIGDRGLSRVQIATGRLVDNRLFPKSWVDSVVTEDLALAFFEGKLELYRAADLRTPVWSVSSGPATPLAVSADLAVVRAESGLVVLDARTGELRGDISLPPELDDFSDVQDGLLAFSDASGHAVVELSPPTTNP